MKKFFLAVFMLSAALGVAARQIVTVVDSADSEAIAGATVFSSAGMILGATEADGAIDVGQPGAFPLTVRSLGYEAVTVTNPVDTIRLTVASYALPEVQVDAAGRPITRVIYYGRQYFSGSVDNDTIRMMAEYMFQSFLADGKVKGYKSGDSEIKAKGFRSSALLFAEESDSVTAQDKKDLTIAVAFGLSKWGRPPTEPVYEPEAIRGGESTFVKNGKYYPRRVYRKTDKSFSIRTDLLANDKTHTYSPAFAKLLGMTMDITKVDKSMMFRAKDSGEYGVDDFICLTLGVQMLCKGKMIKKFVHTSKPILIDSYMEIYPVDVSHITVEEYKQLRKDKSDLPFRLPDNLPPLSPSIAALFSDLTQ